MNKSTVLLLCLATFSIAHAGPTVSAKTNCWIDSKGKEICVHPKPGSPVGCGGSAACGRNNRESQQTTLPAGPTDATGGKASKAEALDSRGNRLRIQDDAAHRAIERKALDTRTR